jgi:hypothetical protein
LCLKFTHALSLSHHSSKPIAGWYPIDGSIIVLVNLFPFMLHFIFKQVTKSFPTLITYNGIYLDVLSNLEKSGAMFYRSSLDCHQICRKLNFLIYLALFVASYILLK